MRIVFMTSGLNKTQRKTRRVSRGESGWFRRFRLLSFFIAFSVWISASPPLSGQALEESGAASTTNNVVPVAELEALVKTLEDNDARTQLVTQLRALIQAQEALGAQSTEEGPGLRARLLQFVSTQVNAISVKIARTTAVVTDFSAMRVWLDAQIREPERRDYWIEMGWQLAAVATGALVLRWLAALLLRRSRARIDTRQVSGVFGCLIWLLVRSLLDLVPIAVFGVAGYFALTLLNPHESTQLIALAFINANLVAGVVIVLSRLVLSPDAEQFRFVRISSETANYLLIWVGRLSAAAIYGFFLLSALLAVGMLPSVFALAEKLLGLLLATMVIILILQNRATVATWIAGRPEEEPVGDQESEAKLRDVESRPGIGRHHIGVIRARFAEIWFGLAILYVIGLFVVWALRIEGGFLFVCRASLVTVAVLLARNFLIRAVGRLLNRGFAISAEIKAQFPGIEAQANRYLPILHFVGKVVISIFAVLSLFQAWGAESYQWVASPLGMKIVTGTVKITMMLMLAVVVVSVFGAWIELYLNKKDSSGTTVQRSARIRTLLPLARKVVVVVTTVVVGLMILSEMSLNIAPLLAGAGIVGLAVGFGAQTLVKDIITGAFILMEDLINAMSCRWRDTLGYAKPFRSAPFDFVTCREQSMSFPLAKPAPSRI